MAQKLQLEPIKEPLKLEPLDLQPITTPIQAEPELPEPEFPLHVSSQSDAGDNTVFSGITKVGKKIYEDIARSGKEGAKHVMEGNFPAALHDVARFITDPFGPGIVQALYSQKPTRSEAVQGSLEMAGIPAGDLYSDYKAGNYKSLIGQGLANAILLAGPHFVGKAFKGQLPEISKSISNVEKPTLPHEFIPVGEEPTYNRPTFKEPLESTYQNVVAKKGGTLEKPKIIIREGQASLKNPNESTLSQLYSKGYEPTGEVNPDNSLILTKIGASAEKELTAPPDFKAPSFGSKKKLQLEPITETKGAEPPPPIEPPKLEPAAKGEKKPLEEQSLPREVYEMSRQLMSVDLPFTTSAAFRQAMPLAGTKNWFKAWIPSVKAYGSKTAYKNIMDRIENDPDFGFIRDDMGVKFTDLTRRTKREEFTRSHLAEKIPLYGKHIAGSNRAYTAFLNDLRMNQAKQLLDDATKISIFDKIPGFKREITDPRTDLNLAREIGNFVNDATGRGSLSTSIGKYNPSLEKHAELLSDVFFSPRLIASRIRMLNPNTYIMANPFVRKQYLAGMLRTIGAWGTFAGLAKMGGAQVSLDPNSSDFGKIKIGNTRIDPAAGFQQYLVLGSRIRSQSRTSSTTGINRLFGKGYKPTTTGSTVLDFTTSKLHPELKFAWDLMNANPQRPFDVGDRMIQLAVPMVAGDLMELAKEDPSIAKMIGVPLAATSGMGVQTYKGGMQQPTFIPRKFDLTVR